MDLNIPDSFRDLLYGLAVEFYTEMPENSLDFSIDYFQKRRAEIEPCAARSPTPLEPVSSAMAYSYDNPVAGPSGYPEISQPVKKHQLGSSEEGVVFSQTLTRTASFDAEEDEDEDDDDEFEPPPIPADYRRKSVFTKSYDPSDDDEDGEEASEFGKYPKTPEMKSKLAASLRQNLLFRNLENEQIDTIVAAMKEVPVRVGDEIIKQGDDGDYFYVIDKGTYDVLVTRNDGTNFHLSSYNNEGCFGDLALMYNQKRSATVQATSNGIVYSLDRSAFQKIVVKSTYDRRRLHEELINSVDLFSNFTMDEKTSIADVLETLVFIDGAQIIKENDEANGMYFVISGNVRVTKFHNDDESEIKLIQTGEYFGELALLNKEPRAANCYAVGMTKLAFLNSEAFFRLMGPCMATMQRNAAGYGSNL